MKLLIILFLIGESFLTFAQEITNTPNKSKELQDSILFLPQTKINTYIPPVKKGKITFSDRSIRTFSNLKSFKDSVSFLDNNSLLCTVPLENINLITERKSKVGLGALYGGVGGFFVGVIAGGLIYPKRNFLEFLVDLFNSEKDGSAITREQAPIVIGATVAGGVIGTLVGLSNKKEKTIYRKDMSVSFYPEIYNFSGKNTGLMLTCKITIK